MAWSAPNAFAYAETIGVVAPWSISHAALTHLPIPGGECDVPLRHAAVRDEVLRAVQDELVADAPVRGRHAVAVLARARLGDAVRCERALVHQLAQMGHPAPPALRSSSARAPTPSAPRRPRRSAPRRTSPRPE